MTRPNPKVSRHCVECGTEFLTGNATVVACSAGCRRARQLRQMQEHQARNYSPVDYPERQCAICPTMFKPLRGDKKFCSKKCAHAAADPEVKRRYRVRKKLQQYGLTLSEFQGMLSSQGGRCAICGTTEFGAKGPQIDHDHHSGGTRGLLCTGCNTGIGLLDDNPHIVRAALEYLIAHIDYHIDAESPNLRDSTARGPALRRTA